VETVIPYYRRFLKTFPTVHQLARADLTNVLKIWEGLGYYSRARNLRKAAQNIVSQRKGTIPDTIEDLLKVPGIGRYTAGAILSIAFNREVPVLDGNIKRVLSRLFALSHPPGIRKTEDLLWEISASLIPKGRAGDFNQALMELGATTCTPKVPRCRVCPLGALCKAGANGNPEQYPVPREKKKIPHRKGAALILQRGSKVLLTRRPSTGLLGGLWEFPNVTHGEKTNPETETITRVVAKLGLHVKSKVPFGTFKQPFSHFKLTLSVYRVTFSGKTGKGLWVPIRKLSSHPMSRIHRRIADSLGKDRRDGKD
jgi:A/G-specific adenine glycosylase